MDNSMGFHKERIALRPVTLHPVIKTDGSMFEFVFSSFYSMMSRSILVLLRGLLSTLQSFSTRILNSFNSLLGTNFSSFEMLSSSNLLTPFFSNLISVFTSSLLNILNMLLLNIINFNINIKLSEFQASLNYLLSFTTILGLTDFNFGV
jgi:hypothetical protein